MKTNQIYFFNNVVLKHFIFFVFLIVAFFGCADDNDDENKDEKKIVEVVISSTSIVQDLTGENGYWRGYLSISNSEIAEIFTTGSAYEVYVNKRDYKITTVKEKVEKREMIDENSYTVLETFDRETNTQSGSAQITIVLPAKTIILPVLAYNQYNTEFVYNLTLFNFHIGPNLNNFSNVYGNNFPFSITEKNILLPGSLGFINLSERVSDPINFQTPNNGG